MGADTVWMRLCGGRVAMIFLMVVGLSGCAAMSAVTAAGSAVDAIMSVAGVGKSDGLEARRATEVSLTVAAGEHLNTTPDGKPLSLVLKVYALRAPDRLRALTYAQFSAPGGDKEALGEDLISVRELIALPGKTYVLPLKLPADATTIGVAGLFRAPFADRWKLAFDLRKSTEAGIVVGAHACALTATQGAPVAGSPAPPASLVGVQCNR